MQQIPYHLPDNASEKVKNLKQSGDQLHDLRQIFGTLNSLAKASLKDKSRGTGDGNLLLMPTVKYLSAVREPMIGVFIKGEELHPKIAHAWNRLVKTPWSRLKPETQIVLEQIHGAAEAHAAVVSGVNQSAGHFGKFQEPQRANSARVEFARKLGILNSEQAIIIETRAEADRVNFEQILQVIKQTSVFQQLHQTQQQYFLTQCTQARKGFRLRQDQETMMYGTSPSTLDRLLAIPLINVFVAEYLLEEGSANHMRQTRQIAMKLDDNLTKLMGFKLVKGEGRALLQRWKAMRAECDAAATTKDRQNEARAQIESPLMLRRLRLVVKDNVRYCMQHHKTNSIAWMNWQSKHQDTLDQDDGGEGALSAIMSALEETCIFPDDVDAKPHRSSNADKEKKRASVNVVDGETAAQSGDSTKDVWFRQVIKEDGKKDRRYFLKKTSKELKQILENSTSKPDLVTSTLWAGVKNTKVGKKVEDKKGRNVMSPYLITLVLEGKISRRLPGALPDGKPRMILIPPPEKVERRKWSSYHADFAGKPEVRATQSNAAAAEDIDTGSDSGGEVHLAQGIPKRVELREVLSHDQGSGPGAWEQGAVLLSVLEEPGSAESIQGWGAEVSRAAPAPGWGTEPQQSLDQQIDALSTELEKLKLRKDSIESVGPEGSDLVDGQDTAEVAQSL